MFLIDDILMLPFKAPVAGVRWVLRQIQTMADNELMNDQVWKERLIELQMKLELGEVTEQEYAAEEAEIFRRLREIRQAREEMAREMAAERDDEGETEISIHSGYGE
ncbi:MAG TPA: gas vesicle protein GvpG [Thermoanaerobaculia bacterium]|nr:gas vesicle protein GvpG [Thermoanaerobaculia bacterium]